MSLEKTDEHRKYYHEGKEIPSCTTIVGLLNKPELVKWANYMGFRKINTTALLEEKATYGTYCHKLFETYFRDGLITASSNSSFLGKQEVREIVYKFRMIEKFFEEMNIWVLNNELPLEGKEYGGTLDLLVYDEHNDSLMILDLKTSKSVYQSHWIQLMGYVQLIEEIYDLPVARVGVLLLSKPVNSLELINIKTTEECWRERAIFNNLKDLYYIMNATEDTSSK